MRALVLYLSRTAEALFLGALPVAVLFYILVAGKDFGFDLRQFWQGAHDVLHGVSPYPSRDLLATADETLTPRGIPQVFRFPHPAGSAVADFTSCARPRFPRSWSSAVF